MKKIKEKKKTKIKKGNKKNIILIIIISLGIFFTSAILAFALFIIISSPDFNTDKLYSKEATVIYAADGTELARIGRENRVLVTYNDLPEVLIDALIATEDSRFFQHNGFDAARFIKASMGQLAGKNAGGASTLSMQVIKNTFTGKVAHGIKGIIRKFTDIYMAVFKLEAVYTKEEIIEFYLNSQWLDAGAINYESINGVEQACQYFFGKSVSDITLAEASLLVGMFNNPTQYSPYYHPQATQKRQATVLDLMVRHGYISKEEAEFTKSIPIESLLSDHSNDVSSNYQAFIDYVIKDVKKNTGDDPMYVPMAIYTTMDMNIQNIIHEVELGNVDRYKFPNDKLQFGIAITDMENGAIRGLSGGRNYQASAIIRGTVRYQPGSTIKPILDYGPYLEYISGSSTATPFIDEPWAYTNGGYIKNNDNIFIGVTNMRYSLVNSRNVPALQAFQQTAAAVGTDKIGEFAHNLGIDYGPTLYESAAIGGLNGGVSPLEMTAAYATFGRGGYYIEPYSYTKIVYLDDTEHEIINSYEPKRVMTEETAYMITDILLTAGNQGVGGSFSTGWTNVAAKTGTTTIDASAAKQLGVSSKTTPDHWSVTFSTDYAIAVHIGYDTITPQTALADNTGIVAKKNVMNHLGRKIYKKNATSFERPDSVVEATVEIDTYPMKLASDYTPDEYKNVGLFKKGFEPSEVSNRFSELSNPSKGSYTFDGTTITINWNGISTPEAINKDYLENFYNENYGEYAEKYYNKRLEYNASNIGEIGYQVYLKNESGDLISLGFTNNTSYTYSASASTSDYTFVIKSAYSIFKDNMSSGLTINVKANVDSNIDDMITPNPDNPDIDIPGLE